MSAIKFSKQFIEPNPQEVDYWVDISTNPYGGVIKYYNGETWAVLTSPDGTPINMDAFYNKLQINQMLATKASVESVESKVDDTELSDLMNNIEFKGKDGNGVDMIIFKYDGTNVGITLPTASNTTAGIITKDQFKDLVKQNQLQSLYSEMYSKVTEIYLKFQKKLKAGKNIKIDETTNTIHATGKISTDWNDLTNVPDLALQPDLEKEVKRATNAESILDTRITSHVTTVETSLDLKADKANTYTKDQIDSKLSGVYRIKGSCLFEQLPTDPTVGDTWNILNDFTLNGEEHSFGTNVVYTDNGWDALAGIFDSSELEGDISGVAEALAQETIRAVKAEQANADTIVAETERATKAEETLQANVDIVNGKLINYVLKTTNNEQNITNTRTHAVFNLYTTQSNECGIRLYANGLYGGGIWTNTGKQTVYIQNNLVSSQLLGIGVNGAYFHYGGNANLLLHEGNYSNYALPLSGGTITEGLLTIKRQPAMIRYTNYADQTLGYIGFGDDANKPRFTMSDGTTNHMLWHEGNDGEGSGLDADMLDGVHVTSSSYNEGVMRSYKVGTFTTANQYFGNGVIVCFDPKPTDNDDLFENTALLSIGDTSYRYRQLAFGWKNYDIKYRYTYSLNGALTFSNWKTLAFTDSNITGNAATATKLATPVKLWGNNFDGSSDVDGNFIMQNNHPLMWKGNDGSNVNCMLLQDNNNLFLGAGVRDNGTRTIIGGGSIEFTTTQGTTAMFIAKSNKVGIGTTDPLYKLHLYGTADNSATIKLETKNDVDTRPIGNNTGSNLLLETRDSAYTGMGGEVQFKHGDFINCVIKGEYSDYKTINDKFNLYGSLCFYTRDYDTQELTNRLVINPFGNVGIGTTNPLYKLDVNGTAHATSFVSDVNTGYYLKDGNGNSFRVLCIPSTNYVSFGHDTAANGYKTTIEGNELLLRYGTKHTNGIILNSSGNVTIGSSDLAGSDYKLHVSGKAHAMFNYSYAYYVYNNNRTSVSRIATGENGVYFQAMDINGISNQGNIHITGYNGDTLNSMTIKAITTTIESNNTIVNNNLSVDNKITSGDLVDWYGVSWSENSSDPTCTRIGNMALHRSLPILSAMKGYAVTNINSGEPELMLPISNDYQNINYGSNTNTMIAMLQFTSNNIMVKIPEFWYIDDYEPSTKTHNLKISQTAKAGWCHHKEAYVGAYEGYNDGTYYRSIKGVTPTVSVSRTTLRPLARANGYEDEYKWNIYTYEEHRAICHLFLVEYATRNSQLAVNTALTSDGFKQGGLGSGCTMGTVTINGVTTYSFIPTGTTNSLGNGSGQVAYTVTLTDADGNETGTVTRYANRYRGIENPFGHIWKHVDDIVNVYDSESGNKTVYKCNKPEHFATNKNAKYKALCAFPGGSKMQGWSKEIKATINCDFFKYSIGGNESTYWCDYNYDNDDTSEHGLLIGGRSGYGVRAGLFRFSLHDGASYSGANIGSRLTYLPWAE